MKIETVSNQILNLELGILIFDIENKKLVR